MGSTAQEERFLGSWFALAASLLSLVCAGCLFVCDYYWQHQAGSQSMEQHFAVADNIGSIVGPVIAFGFPVLWMLLLIDTVSFSRYLSIKHVLSKVGALLVLTLAYCYCWWAIVNSID